MDLSFLQLNNVFWSHSCVFWHCQAARPLSATIRDCVRNLGVVFDPTLPFYIVFDLFLHCQGDQCCCEKQFFSIRIARIKKMLENPLLFCMF